VPAKNRNKIFATNVYYHAYNRGYNQQTIFHDDSDYKAFLYLLRKYLEPGFQEKKYTPRGEECLVEPNHVHREVDLVAFCLMPNHFHLLLFQKSLEGMTKLLVRLCSSYSTYFNQKYEKQGSPFQGIYRAVAVTTEEQLLHLSRYIHLNPSQLIDKLSNYPYSSYAWFLSGEAPLWLKAEKILSGFTKHSDYGSFVEDYLKVKDEEKFMVEEKIINLQLDEA